MVYRVFGYDSRNQSDKVVLLAALIPLFLGLLQIAFPTQIIRIIGYVLGGAFLVVGALYIALYIKNPSMTYSDGVTSTQVQMRPPYKSLSLGMVLTVLGVYFLVRVNAALAIMAVVLGICMMLYGVFGLENALESRRNHINGWELALPLAIITTILGVRGV